jgi:AraC-like DNA-binding protein
LRPHPHAWEPQVMLNRGDAKFFRRVPSAPVSHIVASIWYGENEPAHEFERFLPTGEVDLIINVRDAQLRRYEVDSLDNPRRYVGPVVSGAHCQPYVIHTAQQASLLGVRFKLGRARDVIGVPLHVLGNEHVALSDIWGNAAFALQDSVMKAKTPEELCVQVERFLGARLRGARGPHPVIAEAIRALAGAEDPSPVTAVACASGLSARRFIEVFHRDVGLRPKQFSRVMRFRRALSLLGRGPDESLAALALEAGYYDQAHFTREFKELSGLSPTAYRSARGAYDNQVPILGVKSMQDGARSRR